MKKVFATISRFVGFDLIAAAGLFPAFTALKTRSWWFGILAKGSSFWLVPFCIQLIWESARNPLEPSRSFRRRFRERKAERDTFNANDFIFQKQGGSQTLVAVEEGGGSYRASLIIGIERTRS